MEVKHYQDYIDALQEKFPDLDRQDLIRICRFGLKSLYLHNSYGGDVLIQDNSFWCYFGYLTKDSQKFFNYYAQKLALKLTIMNKRRGTDWDGYYYFTLSDDAYKEYQDQKNARGRKRRKFFFRRVVLHKLKEVCSIKGHAFKYLFRVKMPADLGLTYLKENCYLEDPELIEIRDPLKFKDILIKNNNYDCL